MAFSSQSFPELPVFCFCSSPPWSCWFPSPSQAAWTRSWRRRGWPWSWWAAPRRGWRGLAEWPLHPAHIKDKTCNEFNLKLCKPFNTFNGKMMETCFLKSAIISHISPSPHLTCDPHVPGQLDLHLWPPAAAGAHTRPRLLPSLLARALQPLLEAIQAQHSLTVPHSRMNLDNAKWKLNSSETHLRSHLYDYFLSGREYGPQLDSAPGICLVCVVSLLTTPDSRVLKQPLEVTSCQ